MISIVWSLLIAWILNLFHFGGVVIKGFDELFGISISLTSYYFLFGMGGFIKSILPSIGNMINFKTKNL